MTQAIKKDPDIIKLETIRTIDTIILDAPKLDTVFKYLPMDTMIIKDVNGIDAKLAIDTIYETVYLEVECPEDTVFIEKIVEKTEVKIVEKKETKLQLVYKIIKWLAILIGVIGIITLIRKIL